MAIRILVADPSAYFRAAVVEILGAEPDFVVSEAAGLAGIRTAPTADVALIDMGLPPRGGLAAVRALARARVTHPIVWSRSPDRDSVVAAIRAGARGYLNKDMSAKGLVRAIHGVMHGEAPLPRDLTSIMVDELQGLEQRNQVRDQAAQLSTRERQVLALVARGARNKDIAGELTISEFTVKRHMQNILHKLQLPSRHAAAGFYRSAFDDGYEPRPLRET
jgi:DNA-binding NarL/FixJ family response regulator